MTEHVLWMTKALEGQAQAEGLSLRVYLDRMISSLLRAHDSATNPDERAHWRQTAELITFLRDHA